MSQKTDFEFDVFAEDGTNFDSNAINKLAYNVETQEMAVQFHSGSNVYVYLDVPESLFNMFVSDDSLGSFYRSHISGKYFRNEVDYVSYLGFVEREDEEVPVSDEPVAEVVEKGIEGKQDVTEKFLEAFEETSPAEPLRRFTVSWQTVEETMGDNPEFMATSVYDAIHQLQENINRVFSSGLTIKIRSVTQHFDD